MKNSIKLVLIVMLSLFRAAILLLPPILLERVIHIINISGKVIINGDKYFIFSLLLIIAFIPFLTNYLIIIEIKISHFIITHFLEKSLQRYEKILESKPKKVKEKYHTQYFEELILHTKDIMLFYYTDMSSIIWLVATILLGTFYIANQHILFLLVIIGLTLCHTCFILFLQKSKNKESKSRLSHTSEQFKFFHEMLHQAEYVLLNDIKLKINKKARETFADVKNSCMRIIRIEESQNFFDSCILSIGQVSILLVVGFFVSKNTKSIGDFISVNAIYQWLLPAYITLLMILRRYKNLEPLKSKLLQYNTFYLEKINQRVQTIQLAAGKNFLSLTNVKIKFKNRLLEYPNITCSTNDKIFLSGESGSGKSSLYEAMIQNQEYVGTIAINGVDLSNFLLKSCLNHIMLIKSHATILGETLRDYFVIMSEGLTEQQIKDMLKKVSLLDEVMRLSQGIDSTISEVEMVFSKGELQRLALIPVFIKKPFVVILDEATSNLDVRLERQIIRRLEEELPSSIFIVSSHRKNDVYDQYEYYEMK